MVFDEELKDYILAKDVEMDYFIENVADFNYRGEYYKIKAYLDDFLNDKSIEDRFIIMPGLRGTGKTTILIQLYKYLIEEKNIDKNHILYISMEDLTMYLMLT